MIRDREPAPVILGRTKLGWCNHNPDASANGRYFKAVLVGPKRGYIKQLAAIGECDRRVQLMRIGGLLLIYPALGHGFTEQLLFPCTKNKLISKMMFTIPRALASAHSK